MTTTDGLDFRVGQDERKYAATNPVVVRLIDRFLAHVRAEIGVWPPLAADVGVGEGIALRAHRAGRRRRHRRRVRAGQAVRHAVGHVPRWPAWSATGATCRSPRDAVQLVTCMEVLEHVGDPAALVGELARVTSDRCVVTVPFEPWFRMGNLARGKNVRRLGNDVEHVQAFTPRRLAARCWAGTSPRCP